MRQGNDMDCEMGEGGHYQQHYGDSDDGSNDSDQNDLYS